MRRLEGKDPFRDLDERASRITVPYNAPGKTWGERVQLVVEIPSNFEQDPDFCVLLLNPRHDPKSLKPYILKLLSILLERKTRPISVCILINFRDQQERSPPPRLSEEDVKTWIGETGFQNESVASSTMPMIQTGVTSMLDCYGLNVLHHFLYQSYLHRKRFALEEQLKEVLEASEGSASSNHRIGYDLFLGVLHTPSIQKQSTGTRNSEVVSVVAPTPSRQVGHPPLPRRTFHAKLAPIELPQKGHDTKKALDDFFSDDDSDDDIAAAAAKSNNSDDDDDDFYYDDEGQRTGTNYEGYDPVKAIPRKIPKPKVTPMLNVKDKEGLTTAHESTRKKSFTGKAEGRKEPDTENARSDHIARELRKVIATEPPCGRNEDFANRNEIKEVSKPQIEGDEENGWDDDDDLELEDDDAVLGTDGVAAELPTRNEGHDKPQSNMTKPTVDAEVGWEDDDDLEFDDDNCDDHATTSVGRVDDAVLEHDDNTSDTSYHAAPDVEPSDGDDLELDDDKSGTSHYAASKVSRVGNVTTRASEAQPAAEPSSTLRGDNPRYDETGMKRVGNRDQVQGDALSKGADATSNDCGDDDREYTSIVAEQAEVPTQNRRSVEVSTGDDDDYMIGEADNPHIAHSTIKAKDDDDDDAEDDEFMIADGSSHPQTPAIGIQAGGIIDEDPFKAHGIGNLAVIADEAEIQSTSKRGGLSGAALAAIEEAKREAQRMLNSDSSAQHDDRVKKMKKKKKKRGGDEKKRRKQPVSVVMVSEESS